MTSPPGAFDRIIEPAPKPRRRNSRSRLPTPEENAAWTPHGPGAEPELNVVCVADVDPEEVEWIWPGRIPLSKQTLLGGDPGVGKSFFACDLGARITTGAEWPDGSGRAPLGEVAYIMCEDGIGDTYRPRLDAMGADVSKVFVIQTVGTAERLLSLDTDHELIDGFCEDHPDLKVIVVDPLQGFLGEADSHNNAEVRRVLGPLSKIAERHRVALITIDHLTKQKGNSKALYRTLGSIGLVGNARAAHLFVRDRDDADRVLMLPTKNNLHRRVPGLAYRIMGGRVEWEDGPVDVDADDALSDKPGPNPDKFDQAKAWIVQRLADGHWHESSKVKDDAMDAGITFATYRRAKETLGVKSNKAGSGKWFIQIPHEQQEQLEQLRPLHGGSTGKDAQVDKDAQEMRTCAREHLPPEGLSGNGWPAAYEGVDF